MGCSDRAKTWTEHASSIDASVNWTRPMADGGMLECRYVRRQPDYFIAYVSSHSGCRHACRFCHLTQTGQTMFTPARLEEIMDQFDRVLGHYDRVKQPARRMNINFMARGEPLSNKELMTRFRAFSAYARNKAGARGLELKINLSTILPEDSADLDLVDALGDSPAVLYWSLYSLDPGFRRRWLPRAQAPERAMERLLDWQDRGGGKVAVHFALIDGENDSDASMQGIAEFIRASGLKAKLNLVRYNPFSPRTGAEAAQQRYEAALKVIGEAMTVPGSRIVPRVGFDVKASCGMFMPAAA